MPSHLHEALVTLFRTRERLAVEVLDLLQVAVPSHDAIRITTAELGQVEPVEARADLVLLLDAEGNPVFGIVVEVQLRRSKEKLLSWPLYATTLRSRHGCPSVVLVVTPDEGVARWAAAPIPLGPGNAFRVVVLGPGDVPEVTDPAAAPEFALLSAKVYPEQVDVVRAATLSLLQLDEPERLTYSDILMGWLSPSMQQRVLEMVMEAYPYPQSDFAKEHYGKGLADGVQKGIEEGVQRGLQRGEASALLRLMTRRFGELPGTMRSRIEAADVDTLGRWLDRVMDAPTAEDVVSDE